MTRQIIEEMIRAEVINGWREYTEEGAFYRGEDWNQIQAAIARINAFNQVESGRFSYQQLGYPVLPGNVIPAWVIQEHMQIAGMYGQAREERAALGA